MLGKELIELLKGHEEEEVNIHLARKEQPHIDYQAIATGNYGDGYVLCTPHVTIEHNMVFIEPGIPIGYPLYPT